MQLHNTVPQIFFKHFEQKSKLTERGLCKNRWIMSLSSKVRPIANIINPRAKLYEAGPLFTNHAKVDGFTQATNHPTITYRGYKLAAVSKNLSQLGFAGVRGESSEFPLLTALVMCKIRSFEVYNKFSHLGFEGVTEKFPEFP